MSASKKPFCAFCALTSSSSLSLGIDRMSSLSLRSLLRRFCERQKKTDAEAPAFMSIALKTVVYLSSPSTSARRLGSC